MFVPQNSDKNLNSSFTDAFTPERNLSRAMSVPRGSGKKLISSIINVSTPERNHSRVLYVHRASAQNPVAIDTCASIRKRYFSSVLNVPESSRSRHNSKLMGVRKKQNSTSVGRSGLIVSHMQSSTSLARTSRCTLITAAQDLVILRGALDLTAVRNSGRIGRMQRQRLRL